LERKEGERGGEGMEEKGRGTEEGTGKASRKILGSE